MKDSIRKLTWLKILILICIVGYGKSGFSQSNENDITTQIQLIKEMDQRQKDKIVYAILVSIKNISDIDIYLPYQLESFKEQVRDSIIILKKEGLNYVQIDTINGGRRITIKDDGIHRYGLPNNGHSTSLTRKHYLSFQAKKKETALIIHDYENKNKNLESFNPLFLKKGEKYALYLIAPIEQYFTEEGDYQLKFHYTARENSATLPLYISSFKKMVPPAETSDVFTFSVRRAGNKLKILLEENQPSTVGQVQ